MGSSFNYHETYLPPSAPNLSLPSLNSTHFDWNAGSVCLSSALDGTNEWTYSWRLCVYASLISFSSCCCSFVLRVICQWIPLPRRLDKYGAEDDPIPICCYLRDVLVRRLSSNLQHRPPPNVERTVCPRDHSQWSSVSRMLCHGGDMRFVVHVTSRVVMLHMFLNPRTLVPRKMANWEK